MSVASVQMFSKALGKMTTYNVILPESGDGPFPVLLQLHGLRDDHWMWIHRSNIVSYLQDLPLIVVLPDGGTSAYLNWTPSNRLHQHRYEDFIIDDLAEHVRRHFRVSAGSWAIGGLSMGGYGAMRLGLKYPDRFASIWSHSSAFHIIRDHGDPAQLDPESLESESVFALAESMARSEHRPAISFDCGTEDELIAGNREFDAHLTKIGLEHHYAEHPGGHTWQYWDLHVRDALAQHARVLDL